jgi:hypothetical protein
LVILNMSSKLPIFVDERIFRDWVIHEKSFVVLLIHDKIWLRMSIIRITNSLFLVKLIIPNNWKKMSCITLRNSAMNRTIWFISETSVSFKRVVLESAVQILITEFRLRVTNTLWRGDDNKPIDNLALMIQTSYGSCCSLYS